MIKYIIRSTSDNGVFHYDDNDTIVRVWPYSGIPYHCTEYDLLASVAMGSQWTLELVDPDIEVDEVF